MNRESYDLNNETEQITAGNNVKTRKEKIINKLHSCTQFAMYNISHLYLVALPLPNSFSFFSFSLVGWICTAVFVARFSRFFHYVLLDKTKVNRYIMNAAIVLFTINLILMAYLIVYLRFVKGIHDSSAWDVYCPRVIPTMTFTGVLCFFILLRALWPVYGFFTPLIVIIESFGGLFLLNFIPWMQQFHDIKHERFISKFSINIFLNSDKSSS